MTTEVRPGTLARLRRKNQLTVPDAVLLEIGAKVGDQFLVSVEDGAVRLERVLPSYAGVLRGVYGADWEAELRAGRNDSPAGP